MSALDDCPSGASGIMRLRERSLFRLARAAPQLVRA